MTIKRNRFVHISWIFLSLSGLLLNGCGSDGSANTGSPPPVTSISFQGTVKSGSNAIVGASIQMYVAGSNGYGSAATTLLSNPITTDANGAFSIKGSSYSCPDASVQIYLTATGGASTSLPLGTANASLEMMAALGSCGSLSTSTFVGLSEVTTTAAVWSLAPFMKSPTRVGSTATNKAGLAQAFNTAALLADLATGVSPSAALSSHLMVESAKLYSLANVLATCVNSNGGTSCTGLFALSTTPSSTPPSNTIDAALLIVKNPGNNVSALFQTATANSPYPGLSAAPSDWTMSITTRDGGLSRPTTIAIDSQGKPWVANYPGVVTNLTPMGVPVFPAGISGNGLVADFGLAIDTFDNVWITNRDVNTVTKFSNAGTLLSGSQGYSGGGISFPLAAASDSQGKMWIVNNGNASVTQLSNAGVPASSAGYTGGGVLAFPSAIAMDANNTPWIANMGSGSVTHLSASGALLQQVACCSTPTGIALDRSGNVWVADYLGGSVVRVSSTTGLVLGTTSATGGLSYPNELTIDGNENIWVVNYGSGTFSAIAGAENSLIGSVFSPSTGYGVDAKMALPYGITVDASGNLWITSFGGDRVVRFVGLAAPTKTPIIGIPQIP